MSRDKNLVSVIALSERLGVYKQTVLKAIQRLGIRNTQANACSPRH